MEVVQAGQKVAADHLMALSAGTVAALTAAPLSVSRAFAGGMVKSCGRRVLIDHAATLVSASSGRSMGTPFRTWPGPDEGDQVRSVPAAASLTCSRRALPAAVRPSPSEYLIHPGVDRPPSGITQARRLWSVRHRCGPRPFNPCTAPRNA